MINFSKVMKSLLSEMPNPNPEPTRQNHGVGGSIIEKNALNKMMRSYKPESHQNGQIGFPPGYSNLKPWEKVAPKADLIEKTPESTENRDPTLNNHFSIKSKRGTNDDPFKVQQSPFKRPDTLFEDIGLFNQDDLDRGFGRESSRRFINNGSKTKYEQFLIDKDYGNEEGETRDNVLKQALAMKFGARDHDLLELSEAFGQSYKGGLNSEQMDVLKKANDRSENPFLNIEELAAFPEHRKRLSQHLNANKTNIFNNIVRKNGRHDEREPYRYGDAAMIDEMITWKNDRDRPWGQDGMWRVRDIGDDKLERAMQKLNWFAKDNHLYLSDQKQPNWNQRLLHLSPIDKAASKWNLVTSAGRDAPDNQSMYETEEGKRGWGTVEPGSFKATIGADDEMLNRVLGFPKWSRRMRNGSIMG